MRRIPCLFPPPPTVGQALEATVLRYSINEQTISTTPMNPGSLPSVGSFQPAGGGGFPGMIIREKEPENLEFPFAALNHFITGN